MRSVLFIVTIFLMSLLSLPAWAEKINITFPFQEVEVAVRDMDLAVVRLEGTGRTAQPGAPALPQKTVRLALPPGADLSGVVAQVVPSEVVEVSGRYDVVATPPMARISGGDLDWRGAESRIVGAVDTGIYDVDEYFPSSWGGIVNGSTGRVGRYSFVEISLNPIRYNPVSGKIRQAGSLRVELSFKENTVRRTYPAKRCRIEDLAKKVLSNYDQAQEWYHEPCLPPPNSAGMAIITTEEIVQGSDLLDDYIQLREAQGRTVTLATEADWDHTTGDSNDARSDRIRQWLMDNEITLDIGYALLIGNPTPSGNVNNSIPMKLCAEYDGEAGPTDYFYSSLTGDWDYNGNGVFCESADNPGLTFSPDVYVGRIPVYSDGSVAVDDVLGRILDYETETQTGDISWRRRMLLPNSIYFFANQYGEMGTPRWDGAVVGEWFIRDQLSPRGIEWTSMYERDGLDASQFQSHFPVEPPEIVDQWSRGYGMVFWTGHGSNSGVYRLIWDEDDGNEYPDWNELSSPEFMGSGLTHMLEDAPPPVVIHGSCSNGSPESADNLGYNMLRRGAIATVSASRSALTWHWPEVDPERWEKPEQWSGDVIDIVTEYSVNVLNGMEVGKALAEAIAATGDQQGLTSWYQKSIQNLYGDPLVRLVMCRSDSDCDNGLFCDGEETCDNGSCIPSAGPIECVPTDDCDDMVCDEDAMACIPAADAGCEEPEPEDDAGTPPTQDASPTVSGAKSSCSFSRGEQSVSLMQLLFEVI